MAGYSATPLARKLGIKPGHTLALFRAPTGFEKTLDGLPEGVTIKRNPKGAGTYDVAVAFADSLATLERSFASWAKRLDPSGGLWIAWPKKASGVTTDLTENHVRDIGLFNKLVDNKVCAIDETWSGLRLVVRVKDRPTK